MQVLAVLTTGEIIKEFGSGSSWEKSRLHCTKCTAIIRHVISPTLKEELKRVVTRRKFSLMADESTDCSSSKLMIITIKYFNSNLNQIIFYGFKMWLNSGFF